MLWKEGEIILSHGMLLGLLKAREVQEAAGHGKSRWKEDQQDRFNCKDVVGRAV